MNMYVASDGVVSNLMRGDEMSGSSGGFKDGGTFSAPVYLLLKLIIIPGTLRSRAVQ